VKTANTVAPGARVVIRDAEWLVRKMDRTSTGGFALTVVGISGKVHIGARRRLPEETRPTDQPPTVSPKSPEK